MTYEVFTIYDEMFQEVGLEVLQSCVNIDRHLLYVCSLRSGLTRSEIVEANVFWYFRFDGDHWNVYTCKFIGASVKRDFLSFRCGFFTGGIMMIPVYLPVEGEVGLSSFWRHDSGVNLHSSAVLCKIRPMDFEDVLRRYFYGS